MSWQLTAADLPDLARGATLLGTGGGGDPYIGKMLVERVLGKGSITILDPDELADDLFVIPTAQMGAPTVMIEKIPAGTEPTLALRTLEEHLGRTADATMPIECGGINSMIPLIVAAETGLPVVDADGMGRAFPELSMETFAVYGVHGSPLALAGERGERVVIDTGDEVRTIEFTLDGLSSTVESPVPANEAILDAALRVRGDVPFACAGGVCGTCRARLIEGEVRMTENYALEPDELERGYVLTCQSHPTTERVVVDYDS